MFSKEELNSLTEEFKSKKKAVQELQEKYELAKNDLSDFKKKLNSNLHIDSDTDEVRQYHQNIYDKIMSTEKPIVYTYGYVWKNPTTSRVPRTKEEAIDLVDGGGYATIKYMEDEECLHLNLLSGNDMW